MSKITEPFQGFRGRLIAAGIAGVLVVGGLGAFAMTQPGQNAKPQQHAQQQKAPQKPAPALAAAPHPATPRSS